MAVAQPQITLVHDWLTGMRGGEKCLEILCRRWPSARLYTLLYKQGSVGPIIGSQRIVTSFLQRLPNVENYYRYLLPLMPTAAAGWRLPACDLVVSLSHCVAKSVRVPEGARHVCYCFTPMRYAWHQQHAYFRGQGLARLKARLADRILERLRVWDRETAAGVDHFLAISKTVQQRIRDCYGRPSQVIYPPVATNFYTPAPVPRDDFYLVVGALAPYKRIDLAIDACRRLGKPLVVIGAGQDAARLSRQAGAGVQWLGWQTNEQIRDALRRCRALLFPGEEDFGIVPVEAQACGAPVIAFGQGGATETVLPLGQRHEPTGVWFGEQTAESLADAIERFERDQGEFSPQAARKQALLFQEARFREELFEYLDTVLQPTTLKKDRVAA
jgi:glycosyltransferase involved in cell wall biosynthesis